jgi:hypothetical protein
VILTGLSLNSQVTHGAGSKFSSDLWEYKGIPKKNQPRWFSYSMSTSESACFICFVGLGRAKGCVIFLPNDINRPGSSALCRRAKSDCSMSEVLAPPLSCVSDGSKDALAASASRRASSSTSSSSPSEFLPSCHFAYLRLVSSERRVVRVSLLLRIRDGPSLGVAGVEEEAREEGASASTSGSGAGT